MIELRKKEDLHKCLIDSSFTRKFSVMTEVSTGPIWGIYPSNESKYYMTNTQTKKNGFLDIFTAKALLGNEVLCIFYIQLLMSQST